jgi:hypothetical protein
VSKPWIGYDLDGTLAYQGEGHYSPFEIGHPIPKMVARAKRDIAEGRYEVRIFTARAAHQSGHVNQAIRDWCKKHIGQELPVTNEKDLGCVRIYDDRAVQVVKNSGDIVG